VDVSRVAVLEVKDLLARTRLTDAAVAEGWEVARSVSGEADLVIVDLDQPSALERVRVWRSAAPGARIVGFVSHVDVATRDAAAALGVEVMTRGAAASGARAIFRAGTMEPS
jgi:hypothetical protein